MDFGWSDEQLAYKAKALEFAKNELNDNLVERDANAEFSHEDWNKCAAFGILGLSVPSAYGGGRDTDFLTAMLAMEALGHGCQDNGLTFALNTQLWTVQLPIVKFGSEEQKHKYLPDMCAGKVIGAHAITEPESGSDVFAMQCRAERRGDGYVLNGTKKFVSLGPIADLILVFANADPGAGRWGITSFLVECETEGYRAGKSQDKMGLRSVPWGEIHFDNCFVPEANRLGPEGAGISLSTSSLEYERCCILASQLGRMERQLETCISYARERRQFGQPIGKFQAVANRIVEMKLRLETSRLLLYKVAWLKQSGQSAMTEAALLKLHLSECFTQSSLDAIRIHGGTGYLSETGVERDLRDAVGGTIYAGTSDIQRNIVASLLGL